VVINPHDVSGFELPIVGERDCAEKTGRFLTVSAPGD